jgi:hypothetical protein
MLAGCHGPALFASTERRNKRFSDRRNLVCFVTIACGAHWSQPWNGQVSGAQIRRGR